MKISWVETMVEQGTLSMGARDSIYADCQSLIKNAAAPGGDKVSAVGRALGDAIPFGTSLLAMTFTDHDGAVAKAKSMVANREAILKDQAFAGHEDKAMARFGEVAEIAPSVAANASMSKKLVKARLHEGFTNQDVSNLAMLQAKSMPRVSREKNAAYQVSQARTAAAERLGELCADLMILNKTAAPAGAEKTLGKILKAMKATALVSSIPILAGVGTGIVQHQVAENKKERLEKELKNSFSKALRGNNAMAERLRDNKPQAEQAFKTLTHFAPHVAMDPSAAATYMAKLVNYNEQGMGIDIDSVKTLSEIERNLAQVSKDPGFMQGFRAGTETAGLNRVVSGGVTEAIRPTQKGLGEAINPFPGSGS